MAAAAVLAVVCLCRRASKGYMKLGDEAEELDPTFYFVPAATVLSTKVEPESKSLPRMQTLRSRGLLKKRAIDLPDAFHGGSADAREVLFVSHRWETPSDPDSEGVQLKEIRAYLKAHTDIKYVWYDYWCMPQRDSEGKEDRSKEDKADFDKMLASIGDLYLSMRVLILLDNSYMGRFWTQYEAWSSMQRTTPDGLRPVVETHERRFDIVCIHGAAESAKENEAAMIKTLATKDSDQAHALLAKPDVQLTNAKDKHIILPKLKAVDTHVRRIFSEGVRLHGERQARKSAQNKRAQVEKLREEARREEARLLEEAARLDLLAAQPAARRR